MFAGWLAARPYEGIVLDAQLYILQTLATMNPDPLAGDLFLRFGSQNSFTLFPHLTGPLVATFGVELAAAIVTIASALLLLAAGGCLARHLTGAGFAWLALGLLIGIPGFYGAGEVLRYDEMYLNARVPAEAFCILAVWMACARRWIAATLLAMVAALLHPVMAAPAVGLIVLLAVDSLAPLHYRAFGAPVLAVIGAALLALTAGLLPSSAGPEREIWIASMRSRNAFLFLQDWRLEDWLQNGLGLASLAMTASVLRGTPGGQVARHAAIIGAIGIALAALASMSGYFDPLLLLQPWRWLWLTRFLALVLLPATLWELWRSGDNGRASALLLGSGWALCAHFGGVFAVLGMTLLFVGRHLDARGMTAALRGAWAVAMFALALVAAFGLQAIPLALDNNAAPRWVQQVLNFASIAGPLACLTSFGCVLLLHARTMVAPLFAFLGAATIIGGVVSYQLFSGLEPRYSNANVAIFAEWRAIISSDSEVLWHEDPVAVWVLLNRRSFLSGSQSAGLLYSPGLAREFHRRGEALASLASPGWWTLAAIDKEDEPKTLTPGIMRSICQEPELDYIVDTQDLGMHSLRVEWPSEERYVYLYDCGRLRGGMNQ